MEPLDFISVIQPTLADVVEAGAVPVFLSQRGYAERVADDFFNLLEGQRDRIFFTGAEELR